jgi:hypothetical protein
MNVRLVDGAADGLLLLMEMSLWREEGGVLGTFRLWQVEKRKIQY